jgi:hypothetical protein
VQIAIVVNQSARALSRRPELADRIAELASGRAECFRTRTLDDLAAAARRIADRGHGRVVLAGGDGSLMAGVTALAGAFAGRPLPELVLAPGGTVATVAKNFGQRAGLLATVRAALDGARGDVRERPTLHLEFDGQQRIGFIFGTGLVARFFEKYYASGAGGYAAAARIVARVFVGSFRSDAYAKSVLDPMPCRLEVDGRVLAPAAFSLVCCSVVRDLGLHLLVTHRAGEDPARPHLVASSLSTRELGPQAPRVFAGKPLAGDENFDGLVERFAVCFPGEGGTWVLDGDVFRSRTVSVSAGPRIRLRTFS